MAVKKTYYQFKRKEMAIFLPEEYDKVLEIGCGEGNFKTNLKTNCEIWGVESNEVVANIASKKLHKVLVGKYHQVLSGLPDDYFDLVVCNDVIEHMDDHDYFFESIKTKMKENAALVGSIPNVRYYFNLKNLLLWRDWKYTDSGILDRTHLRFFTEKSLKATFKNHNFIIEKFKGINKIKIETLNLSSLIHISIISLLVVLSLGSYKDIQYTQFGFSIKKMI